MVKNINFEIRKFSSPPFFFTDSSKISDYERIIKNLAKNSTIIIREYDLDKNSRLDFAKRISFLARNKGLKILVGKDFELARKIKADGVHFSDFDRLPIQFFKKKTFAKNFIFSFAAHSEKSIIKFGKFNFDFIFLSPIFPTTSHKDSPTLGLKNLRKIVTKNKSKSLICALGGVNYNNIRQLRKNKISSFGAIDFFTLANK